MGFHSYDEMPFDTRVHLRGGVIMPRLRGTAEPCLSGGTESALLEQGQFGQHAGDLVHTRGCVRIKFGKAALLAAKVSSCQDRCGTCVSCPLPNTARDLSGYCDAIDAAAHSTLQCLSIFLCEQHQRIPLWPLMPP